MAATCADYFPRADKSLRNPKAKSFPLLSTRPTGGICLKKGRQKYEKEGKSTKKKAKVSQIRKRRQKSRKT